MSINSLENFSVGTFNLQSCSSKLRRWQQNFRMLSSRNKIELYEGNNKWNQSQISESTK